MEERGLLLRRERQGQSLGRRAERARVWRDKKEEAPCSGKQNLQLLSLFPKCYLFSVFSIANIIHIILGHVCGGGTDRRLDVCLNV